MIRHADAAAWWSFHGAIYLCSACISEFINYRFKQERSYIMYGMPKNALKPLNIISRKGNHLRMLTMLREEEHCLPRGLRDARGWKGGGVRDSKSALLLYHAHISVCIN